MKLENAFVTVADAPAQRTSYVDSHELEEALKAYFDGSIDDVVDLSRLWLPVEQLIPGKPLLSQLDSDLMAESLAALPDRFAVAIAHHYQPQDPDLLEWLMRSFVHDGADDFAVFCHQAYLNGLLALAEVVRRKL